MVALGVGVHDHSESALTSLEVEAGVAVLAVLALAELGAFYTSLEAFTVFLLAA
jgi:hypothetical protein